MRSARQGERENRAAPGLGAGGDLPAVVFDDAFANREAEAGAVRFAMGGKGLEEPRGYLRRDPRAGVFEFGSDARLVGEKNAG